MGFDRKPVLVINPIDDADFAAAAERLVAEGITSIEEFLGRLRGRYPEATAHRREIVAEPVLVWYVYRDGHWVNTRLPTKTPSEAPPDDRSTPRSQGHRAGDPPRR